VICEGFAEGSCHGFPGGRPERLDPPFPAEPVAPPQKPVARGGWLRAGLLSARAFAEARNGSSSRQCDRRCSQRKLLRALNRLDVVNAAAIPLRAEPAATRCGEMVE
jgi:hypothetical protein